MLIKQFVSESIIILIAISMVLNTNSYLIPATREKGKCMLDTEDRGFASMDPEQQKEIASKGGKASHGGGRGSQSDE